MSGHTCLPEPTAALAELHAYARAMGVFVPEGGDKEKDLQDCTKILAAREVSAEIIKALKASGDRAYPSVIVKRLREFEAASKTIDPKVDGGKSQADREIEETLKKINSYRRFGPSGMSLGQILQKF